MDSVWKRLPVDILEAHILPFLPEASLVRNRCVCKSWKRLCFILYLKKNGATCLVKVEEKQGHGIRFSVNKSEGWANKEWVALSLLPCREPTLMHFAGTSAGLVCMNDALPWIYNSRLTITVFNPVTEDCKLLPQIHKECEHTVFAGMEYSSECGYKVVYVDSNGQYFMYESAKGLEWEREVIPLDPRSMVLASVLESSTIYLLALDGDGDYSFTSFSLETRRIEKLATWKPLDFGLSFHLKVLVCEGMGVIVGLNQGRECVILSSRLDGLGDTWESHISQFFVRDGEKMHVTADKSRILISTSRGRNLLYDLAKGWWSQSSVVNECPGKPPQEVRPSFLMTLDV